MNLKTESAIAAKWWADQLRDPNMTHDLGMEDASAARLTMMANVFSRMMDRPPADKVNLFELLLRDKIREMASSQSSITISVDYHPNQILSEAAEKAGIKVGMLLFPSKTTMWVREDKVSVSAGYGADTENIYIIKRAEMHCLNSRTGEARVEDFTSLEEALSSASSSITYATDEYRYTVPLKVVDLGSSETYGPSDLLSHQAESHEKSLARDYPWMTPEESEKHKVERTQQNDAARAQYLKDIERFGAGSEVAK